MLKREMKFVAQLAFVWFFMTWGIYNVFAIGTPGIQASPPAQVSTLSGLGTGVATALGTNVGSAGAPVVQNGALGTPSSGTLTNCTGLPVAGGGTGAATLTGVLTGNGTSAVTASAVTNHGVVVAGASNALSTVAPGTSGNVLTSNGTDWTSAASAAGGVNLSTSFEIFDELIGTPPTAATTSVFGWASANSGAGAAFTGNLYIDVNSFGVWRASTGTTTTGYSVMYGNYIRVGGGVVTMEWRVYTPSAVSDGTDTYTLRAGCDNGSPGDGSTGIFFRYTDAVNGGRWQCVSRAASVESTADSGIAVAANTYYNLKIIVNAGASSITYYINGASVGTIATNIPAAGSSPTINFGIAKSLGTTARAFQADYFYLKWVPTTPR
jgi:hypothetical protein